MACDPARGRAHIRRHRWWLLHLRPGRVVEMLLNRFGHDDAAVAVALLDDPERLCEDVVAGARGPVDLQGGEDRAVHPDGVVVDRAADDALISAAWWNSRGRCSLTPRGSAAARLHTIARPGIAAPASGTPGYHDAGDRPNGGAR